MTARQHPAVRAPKPNQHERVQRQATIDNLLGRALRGVLTIPEAAVLAEYWRAERRLAEKTRRGLGDTTRALQRHREAADAVIQALEARVAELEAGEAGETAPGAVCGSVAAELPARGAPDARGAAGPSDGRTAA